MAPEKMVGAAGRSGARHLTLSDWVPGSLPGLDLGRRPQIAREPAGEPRPHNLPAAVGAQPSAQLHRKPYNLTPSTSDLLAYSRSIPVMAVTTASAGIKTGRAVSVYPSAATGSGEGKGGDPRPA